MTCTTMRTLENYIGDISTPDIRWTPRKKDAVAVLIRRNEIDPTIVKKFFSVSQEELDTWINRSLRFEC